MDGTTQPKAVTIGGLFNVFGLVILILALGFVGALVWLLLQ